ncbi:Glutamate-1-semialdehyde aminotransferase [Candidatus Nitrosotalea sp. TS]|uniref:hypothetical protein n=1 Tax=Candidatus Nitrosotalea sp. TS TaxID=2341020 RepID=UPI001EB87CB6|nr:hypothetical protein [Candidatus Nitrosotalea sp. TS]NHI03937.1 Glutamate-1-semialdehyde aminotransferase [Candidatus Nitrosotalea sp. TS]
MFQIFFTDKQVVDYSTAKAADAMKFKKLFKALLQNEIFIAPSQFETVFLSYAHTDEDMQKTVIAYEKALKTVKA